MVDLIVTPSMSHGKDEIDSGIPATIKRNSSKSFDKASKD
jgi:hypothetical protein